jgi:hypothetical protein
MSCHIVKIEYVLLRKYCATYAWLFRDSLPVLCSLSSDLVCVWFWESVHLGVVLLTLQPDTRTFCVSFSGVSRPMELFSIPSSFDRLRCASSRVLLRPVGLWLLSVWARPSRVVQALCCLILRLDL